MTGNIKIHEAVWATICGHIVFSTNFTHRKYRLTIGDGIRLVDLNSADGTARLVTRDEVLNIIRQGDDAMWTWPSFLTLWGAWADGLKAGRSRACTGG